MKKQGKLSLNTTSKVNNLLLRTLTGFVFVVAIIGSILLDRIAFSLLFLVFNILALIEFYKLINTKLLIGTTGGVTLYILSSFVAMGIIPGRWLLLLLLIPLITITVGLFSKHNKPFDNIATTFSGIIYVSVPFAVLNFLYSPSLIAGDEQPNILLGFFLVLWMYDTFAYLSGISFGKHKLFKRISPKKTWEGTLGGFMIGMLVSWVLSLYFSDLNLIQWLGLGLITIVFGTIGDLAESMIKRSMNVKDSGKLMPGHGGLLDRFDATLFAAPAVFVYLVFAI
jgi:phosphatidate cytidylyltransferase